MKTAFEMLFKRFFTEDELRKNDYVYYMQGLSYVCGILAPDLRTGNTLYMNKFSSELKNKLDIPHIKDKLKLIVGELDDDEEKSDDIESVTKGILLWTFQRHTTNIELSSKLCGALVGLGNRTPFDIAYTSMEIGRTYLLRPHINNTLNLFLVDDKDDKVEKPIETLLAYRDNNDTLRIVALVYTKGQKISRTSPKGVSFFSIRVPGKYITNRSIDLFLQRLAEKYCKFPYLHTLAEKAVKLVLATKLFIDGVDVDIDMEKPNQEEMDKLKALNARRKKNGKRPIESEHTELTWHKLGYGPEFDRIISYNVDEWQRSGHFRWQPYGPERSLYKLIWIDEMTCKRRDGILRAE